MFLSNEKTAEYLSDIRERHEREQAEVSEKELYDIDFTLYLDKQFFLLIGMVGLSMLLLFIKTFGRELYGWFVKHQIPTFRILPVFSVVLFCIGIIVFVAVTVLCFYLWFQPKPHIVRGQLWYRNQKYHYSEITQICIRTAEITTIYANGKRLFTVTGDYMNYGSLIAWAETCHIPIQRKTGKEMDPEQIEEISKRIIIIMLVLIIFVPVFLILYYILR